jgi:hypothetical protein
MEVSMMSTHDNVVPLLPAPGTRIAGGALRFSHAPGLRLEAIQGLEASYPGILTDEMRSLLQATCGLTAAEFGTIDFTSRWHPAESLNVFHPCLTLATDDEGRRWIAETSRLRGLPGPVWCVLPEPAVAIYASDDLGALLSTLDDRTRRGRLSKWLRSLDQEARTVWACRQTLARESYRNCQHDRGVRGWLAELPFDAYVYDLRVPSALRGWPYGMAGPDGRLFRCGHLPVFAVSASPSTSRWRQHVAEIAVTGSTLTPAVARSRAA